MPTGSSSSKLLELRRATPVDGPLLRRWDTEPHVRAGTGGGDWGWEAELPRALPWREFLIAEVAGAPVGFMQIIDPAAEETRYWGDCGSGLRAIDLWIGPAEWLGRGCGTRMMQLAIARCFAEPGVSAIVIDPMLGNHGAQRFYARLGFRAVGERRFGEDVCLVMRLDRPG